MAKAVILIKADGTVTKTVQDKAPGLAQLQAACGGYIQIVPHLSQLEHEGRVYKRGEMYCNEDGIGLKLPFNAVATAAWLRVLGKGPFIYEPRLLGDVIFYATE